MPLKDPQKLKEYQKEYRCKNKDRINARNRERRKNDPVFRLKCCEYTKKYQATHKDQTSKYYFSITKNYHLKKKYGITLEEYNKMFEGQNGVCFLCGKTNVDRLLAVDHNHETGKVRKLLCTHCNYLVGIIENHENEFSKIKKYINEYNRVQTIISAVQGQDR